MRNAVAARRPGSDDIRGRQRDFESRWRPQLYGAAVRMIAKSFRNVVRSAGGLEALVAGAPIFRPLHSLLDFAGGLCFLPFGAAFFFRRSCAAVMPGVIGRFFFTCFSGAAACLSGEAGCVVVVV
jgi:hypothetical protein